MQILKYLRLALGFFCLLLAAIGLFLPIWPTTPFVLIALACFSASPALREKVMSIAFFRAHLENYTHRTGLSPKTLLMSLLWLWGMLCLSALVTRLLWVSLLLLFVGLLVTLHLCWMARKRETK